MEKIVGNPGLQHLAENVFWNLDVEDLKLCAQINLGCNQILKNPIFCLRKFEHISKENQKDWINAIQSVKNPDKGIAIISYFQWNLKKDALVDLPCYSSPAVQDDFRMRIWECCDKLRSELSDEDIEIVKILAPLIDNPNAPDKNGDTPIIQAAFHGNTVIIKILVPLTDNPNAPNNWGSTPIHFAALDGNTEIVKILAPLTDNPNAPNQFKMTPIEWAARDGHTEIVKILTPLTATPNAPNNQKCQKRRNSWNP